VPCPNCAGEDRTPLAPGYFRCESLNLVGLTQDNQPVAYSCGYEYHEGSGLGVPCFFGMYAVGRCSVCSAPMCGDHRSRRGNGTWECLTCQQAALQRARQRDNDREAAFKEEYLNLPPVPDDVLKAWIAGDLPREAVVDGQTHRSDHLTCRDVATMLNDMLGVTDYTYLLSGLGVEPKDPPGRREAVNIAKRAECAPTPTGYKRVGYFDGNSVHNVSLDPAGQVREGYYHGGNGNEYNNGAGTRRRLLSGPESRFVQDPYRHDRLLVLRRSFYDNAVNVGKKRRAKLDDERIGAENSARDAWRGAGKIGCLLVVVLFIAAAVILAVLF
jgi:hypothetical protein